MRHLQGVIWTLIAVCFLALMGCAHDSSFQPATSHDLRSGTTTDGGLSPTTNDIIERNHGGGREGSSYHVPTNMPRLQMPALRGPSAAPLLAGFTPSITSTSNVQPSYGWFAFAIALLFALIYAVRRSNARPDEQEPKFRA